MAQTKSQIQSLLAQASSAPRHRFGQNFMIDQNLVRLVAAAGQIAAGDVVIEVGPGTGTLTEELLASHARRVVAVEIDRDLAALLRERFATDPRFHLIEGDTLAGKHGLNAELAGAIAAAIADGSTAKLVANLPYNIASPLVVELLLAGVSTLAFTVQKEVADRLRAAAGDDAYGPLSVVVQRLATVQVLRTLPAQAFWPAPKIQSALVRVVRQDHLGPAANAFSQFVHRLFAARRKTLRNALLLADVPPHAADAAMNQLALLPQQRPETLTPPQLQQLFEAAPTAARPAG